MSTSLYCEDGGREVALWQTPSHITAMCLSWDEKGKSDGGTEGVRRRYLLWVKSHTDGVWQSAEDLKDRRALVEAHVQMIKALKSPKFGYM